MDRKHTVIALLAATAYYAGFVGIALWQPFPAGIELTTALIALPGFVFAVVYEEPETLVVPLAVWVPAALALTLLMEDTGDLGRLGLFLFLLFVQTPVIVIAFVIGKGIRWILARRSAQY